MSLVFGAILFFVIFIVFLASFLKVYSYWKMEENWKILSKRLGTRFESGGIFGNPRIEGSYKNHQILLKSYYKGFGRSKQHYTGLMVTIKNPGNVFLQLYPEGVLEKVEKAFGIQDIILGEDETFDKRFMIKGNKPELIRKILGYSVQHRILGIKNFNLKVENTYASFENRGFLSDIDNIMAIMDATIEIAEKIERQESITQ